MGITDWLLSAMGGGSDRGGNETFTREELRRDSIENERINVMPVEKPSNRLRKAHPNMPELKEKYEDIVACHLFHPDSDLTLYPITMSKQLRSNNTDEQFPLVVGIESHMEVPFVIYSAEDFFLPDDAVLINSYEGGLLTTPWGEAFVIPCDLALPHEIESVEDQHRIPLPEQLHQRTIQRQMLNDEEMQAYYNLAMSGMMR